ncbi:hypothetical protein C8F01DRAFT_1083777 [Mycena amicta]|nr:hypothetical protein C8F01DRAFT_1083777 [Mycena amicta]
MQWKLKTDSDFQSSPISSQAPQAHPSRAHGPLPTQPDPPAQCFPFRSVPFHSSLLSSASRAPRLTTLVDHDPVEGKGGKGILVINQGDKPMGHSITGDEDGAREHVPFQTNGAQATVPNPSFRRRLRRCDKGLAGLTLKGNAESPGPIDRTERVVDDMMSGGLWSADAYGRTIYVCFCEADMWQRFTCILYTLQVRTHQWRKLQMAMAPSYVTPSSAGEAQKCRSAGERRPGPARRLNETTRHPLLAHLSSETASSVSSFGETEWRRNGQPHNWTKGDETVHERVENGLRGFVMEATALRSERDVFGTETWVEGRCGKNSGIEREGCRCTPSNELATFVSCRRDE